MQQLIRRKAGSRAAVALRCAAVALLSVAALVRPDISYAAHGGGGGGFHGGGGGFHGGGFHGGFGGFRGGGFGGWHGGYGGGWSGGRWNYGWHNGRYGWWLGPGLGFAYGYPYAWGYWPDYGYYGDYGYGGYGDYGYGGYGYGQPSGGQYWYYCSDPAGYYPYVQQCNVQWQPVPPS
jgi:hypothetical protein